MQDKKLEAICKAAKFLETGNVEAAGNVIMQDYPFRPVKRIKRKYRPRRIMEQFFHDGFIDRYSGKKLINPGILNVLSVKMPEVFPFHEHWKTSECHTAYWDFRPTIDHIDPLSLGGEDSLENWASTSMVNNAAKGNFTLEQLGWELKAKGDIKEWDGLSGLFVQIVKNDSSLLEEKNIKKWYNVTKQVMKERDGL